MIFEERIKEKCIIRTFLPESEETELKWHYDEEDRIVEPLSENDWMIQLDNELPLKFDREIFIKKGIYHRIIKGSTILEVKIIKRN